MLEQHPLLDPWAITEPDGAIPMSRRVRAVFAWLLSLGMLAEAWRYGGGDARPVLVTASIVAIVEVVLRSGSEDVRRWPARMGAVVALTLVSSRQIGATPAVLTVMGLLVADGALCGWRPTPGWPQRRQPTASMAIGVLVAAEIVWFRSASRPVTLGVLAAAFVVLEIYARRPQWSTGVERVVRHTSSRVVWFVFGVVFLVVATILLYLPGSVVRAAHAVSDRRRWRNGRSTWVPRSVSVQDQRRDARRPFVSTEPALRSRRMWRGLTAVAVIALLVGVVRWAGPTDGEPMSSPGISSQEAGTSPAPPVAPVFAVGLAAPYSQIPAYRGVPWADALQKVQGTLVVDGNQTSRYRNIRNGDRVTISPPQCDCRRVSMWISGGSAVFGEGQRDAHTIASELVRTAAEDGIALDLHNVSRDGYTFQMEAEWQVLPRLRNEHAPQLLVFYNGFNDVMAELAGEFLKGSSPPLPQISAILPPEIDAINERSKEFLSSGIGPAAGHAAAARYSAVRSEVDAAAKEAGVKVAYFFQADALTSAAQLRPYEAINGIPTQEMLSSPLSAALDVMSTALEPGVTNLRSALAASEPPYFLGLVHHNEAGAKVVADDIYRKIRPEIHRLAR